MSDPSAFVQILTWGTFMLIFVLAWNLAIFAAMNRYDRDWELVSTSGFRRPYVLVLGMYTFAIAILNIGLLTLCSYSVCVVMCIVACNFPEWLERVFKIVFSPSSMFNFISMEHLKFHGVSFIATLLAMAGITWTYIDDSDLNDGDALRPKVIQLVNLFPSSVLMPAYGVYAVYSVICAYQMSKIMAK